MGSRREIGFHPSIRNFAVEDDRAIFSDTFRRLIHYFAATSMGRLFLQIHRKAADADDRALMRARVNRDPVERMSIRRPRPGGIVGSACGCAPGDSAAFLGLGAGLRGAARCAPGMAEIIEGLARPPRCRSRMTRCASCWDPRAEPENL